MVVGLSLPFGVGDVVRLTATADDGRRPLVGETGTVVAVQPGSRFVLASVDFDADARSVTLVHGVDEVELVERYAHPVAPAGTA
ncbi:MAG TPA: hypothetical protein DEP66_04850 [Acidimicrobiaceae bacterium]|nr:hypothetical protein [Acidimicrobiaceae bacterium]HCB37526.1 hypothetical protein [Acidimicrobiaceae bacterium]